MKQKATIIEFVGPPGAGKTFSCKYFAEQLRNEGLRVLTLNDLKSHIENLNLSEKFLLVLKACLFRSHILLFYIAELAFHRIYSINSIYRYIRLTLFDIALRQFKNDKKVDIVLLDQWIIQEIWSATIFRAKSYSTLSKSLSKFYFNTDVIFYLDIDTGTASERIGRRTSNLSRFDRMDTNKRLEELQNFSAYLFQLYKSSDCKQKHIFSGHKSPEENAGLFIKHLSLNLMNTV